MCETIKMMDGPPFKAPRKFKPYAPDLKDGEIVITYPACTENYVVKDHELSAKN
ncbi:MAG: hypothetical protein ACXADD_15090 [Candidatus Thorarchaeota archaeon]